MKWFGETWGAPVCNTADHVATPVGKNCLDCGGPIYPHSRGLIVPYVQGDFTCTNEPHHTECFLQDIFGAEWKYVLNWNLPDGRVPLEQEEDEASYE